MARRLLRQLARGGGATRRGAAVLGLCLGLFACKHEQAAPKPAPAPVDSATEITRQQRFDSELKRAQVRWQEKPDLSNCAEILQEKADTELCLAASNALGEVLRLAPTATPEAALPVLANASLALVRLVERARYLNMEDMSKRRLEGADAGAPAASALSTRAHAPTAPAASASSGPIKLPRAMHGLWRERATLKLTDSPISRVLQNAARLERDVLRNLSAYLEYAPLPVRRAAFDTVKQLQAQHPQWATLGHVLREATVLETDAALKQDLNALANATLPRGKRPDQPTGSK